MICGRIIPLITCGVDTRLKSGWIFLLSIQICKSTQGWRRLYLDSSYQKFRVCQNGFTKAHLDFFPLPKGGEKW